MNDVTPQRHLRLVNAAATVAGPMLEELRTELDVPGDFPPEALAEAERAAARPVPTGADATELPLVTIDPPGAKDLDQAMYLERDGDGYLVHYAIADPASFVQPGGALDAALADRGVTFYGPDTSITLHPAVLSEGAASLLPEQTRPACLWTIRLDAAGEIRETGVRRALVRSREQLTYAQVQQRLDDGTAGDSLALLPEIGTLRAQLEIARGGASLEIPEQEVASDDDGYRLVYRANLPVEDWNAQISLLTGIAAAGLMRTARIGVLRTLQPAQQRDINRVRRAAHGLDIDWPAEASYGEVLAGLDATVPEHAAFFHEATALFRGSGYLTFDGDLPPASPHSAIAAEYAHVTAPLRRLVDRYGLEICLAATAGADVPDWVRTALADLPGIMDRARRRSAEYERNCVDLLEAIMLRGRIGQQFSGVVVDVDEPRGGGDARGAGEADEEIRGTILIAEPAIRARVSGAGLPLGEKVTVRLARADVAERRVEFAY
ncbi:MAG TPA: RNB domain-containing ribonuclease [Candidatus Ruania gallistercoris]|uniref:RNB domain-containing ribonuclease n=1 Tax=Candidatus Ruania gallistercoris TaxID=2838746 RepID=A0A9D2EFF8_9MICO|nr:RNB domain-containing ribonuclease [Candidatus Ruania gallistercoris]